MQKRRVKILVYLIICLIINVSIFNILKFDFNGKTIDVKLEVKSNNEDVYQVLYSEDGIFSGEKCVDARVSNKKEYETLVFNIPKDSKQIRLDFGSNSDELNLKELTLVNEDTVIDILEKMIQPGNDSHQIGEITQTAEGLHITLLGEDPYVILNIEDISLQSNKGLQEKLLKIVVCLLANIVVFIFFKAFVFIKELTIGLYKSRKLIYGLSRNDFKTKYAGSYLGITWAFVQPIVTVLIYWFVFQVGFKSAPMGDFPFVLWLIAGMIPWFFFNESLLNATNSLLEYNYLVKKVVFNISSLPIVKIISSLYVHLFFIVFANGVYLLYGYKPSIYMVQIIYYTFCTFCLVLSISYATSAMVVFFKDLGQIVNILLQFGMWLTPIMWSYEMISPKYQWILKLNPMYYIVEGYRDTFIRKVWFWERMNQSILFWIITVSLFVIGAIIFKKLKEHFADVL